MDEHDFHCPKPGMYFAAWVWTWDEAVTYAETGKYPQRLCDLIREEYERQYGK